MLTPHISKSLTRSVELISGTQGVVLQVQQLGAVDLGDPSVTDQPVSQTRVPKLAQLTTASETPDREAAGTDRDRKR